MPISEECVSQAIETAERIFDVEIQTNLDAQSTKECLGEYNFINHTVSLYEQFIENLATITGTDRLSEIVSYAVSHEYGHAKDAELYSSEAYFPYKTFVSPTATITADEVELNNAQVKLEIPTFIDTIFDFGIDKQIHSENLSDHTPMLYLNPLRDDLRRLTQFDGQTRTRKKLLCLLSLPVYVNYFNFGSLYDPELFRRYAVTFIGETMWNDVSAILLNLEYGDIEILEMIPELLELLFNLSSEWHPIEREDIETDFTLPEFWSSDFFSVLRIT